VAPDQSASPLLKDSSASDWDFSALEEAQPDASGPESTDVTPETNVCPTCSKPVVRLPGQRGKLAKYHAECKPTARQRITGSHTASKAAGNPKAAREADEVISMIKPKMMQGALMLAAVDQYDAFVFLNGINPFCESLHGVLVRYDSFRKDALAMKAGGSIFGLCFTAITMALPILAHHGLIPGAKIQELLIQFPVMMFKLSQRMKEGEEALNDMMTRVSNEMLRKKDGPNNGATGQNGATGDYGTP
jgi:hypothetical protein